MLKKKNLLPKPSFRRGGHASPVLAFPMRGFIYLPIIFTIAGWWWWAFSQPSSLPYTLEAKAQAHVLTPPPLLHKISVIDRSQLLDALNGNYALMSALIHDWEIDAILLEKSGAAHVKRLSETDYLMSQWLERTLSKQTSEHKPKLAFLPQTYAAASFLLALSDPEEIVALPKGLRNYPQLFPPPLLRQISLEIDDFTSEQLIRPYPVIAFVADYSDPSIVQTLLNRGMELVSLPSAHSVREIKETARQMGQVCHKPLQGELMALFIEAAFCALDNRLELLQSAHPEILSSTKFLYLSHNTRFTTPAPTTAVGQLLTRMGIYPTNLRTKKQKWSVPLEHEEIRNLHPDCLLLSTSHPDALCRQVKASPALATTPAVRYGNLLCIDDTVQQFPTQHVVLAYYDLIEQMHQVRLP